MSGLSLSGTGLTITGGGGSSSITIGSTPISGGTSGNVVYDNAGVAGELSTTGTGSVVLQQAPTVQTRLSVAGTADPPFTMNFAPNGVSNYIFNIDRYGTILSTGGGAFGQNYTDPTLYNTIVGAQNSLGGLGIQQTGRIYWTQNGYASSGYADTGLARNAAGIVEATNGNPVSQGGTLGGFIGATQTLAPSTAPAAPSSGWTLYTDSGDGNKLKAKASTGTIVTLGTP